MTLRNASDPSSPLPIQIGWISPLQGLLKINFDGFLRETNGGADFVILDYFGRPILAGSRIFTIDSVPQMELRAA